MEASYKLDFGQWKTVDHEKYCLQMNGGRIIEANEATTMGNYNALMLDSKEYQKCKKCQYLNTFTIKYARFRLKSQNDHFCLTTFEALSFFEAP